MKVVILAGGLGTRLAEETEIRPKPMVEIGGKPILWHIMKIYSHYGFHDFVVCLGYRGYQIKEYFTNYVLHNSDVTIDVAKNAMTMLSSRVEPWRVTLVDTGDRTQTGGRVKRILPYVQDDPAFCLTYGDGVSNVDVPALIDLHHQEGRLVTVTGVRPPGRFGAIKNDGARVTEFLEKPQGDGTWINGGFMVCSPRIGDYIHGDEVPLERAPMEQLTQEGELSVHFHEGFWQPMDTLRDKVYLNGLWEQNAAPWKLW